MTAHNKAINELRWHLGERPHYTNKIISCLLNVLFIEFIIQVIKKYKEESSCRYNWTEITSQ